MNITDDNKKQIRNPKISREEWQNFATKHRENCPHKGTVGYELRSVNNMLRRCVHGKNSAEFGKSVSEVHFWIMGYLQHHSEQAVFQRDLEAEFEVRRSTMTGILQTMEKSGLIERQSVGYDGRLKQLVLTEKASKIIADKINEIREFEAALVRGVSPEELSGFYATISKIKENLADLQSQS